jgi:energy-converting hydrogenase A subunit R
MPQLNIDCEGPITQNDNAYELCDALIPEGGNFFARVSKYDDYLADIEKRQGYKAGDTLKLVLPFLMTYGATNKKMEEFSEKTLMLLPGICFSK